jgi:hypothetical protein
MQQHTPLRYNSPQDYAREAVLEEVADRLLAHAATQAPPAAYPYYNERTLRRRQERDEQAPRLQEASVPPAPPALRLALRLLTRTHLAPRKRLAFRLLARGRSAAQVAALLGLDRPQLSHWKTEVCRLLRQEFLFPPDDLLPPDQALREALREDMQRRAAGAEHHCQPGQEACRGTGLCVCRWYLHYLSD